MTCLTISRSVAGQFLPGKVVIPVFITIFLTLVQRNKMLTGKEVVSSSF
jgi:hypothetical protein